MKFLETVTGDHFNNNAVPLNTQTPQQMIYPSKQALKAQLASKEITAFDSSFTCNNEDFGEIDGLAQTARVVDECSLFRIQEINSQLSLRDEIKGEHRITERHLFALPDRTTPTSTGNNNQSQQNIHIKL